MRQITLKKPVASVSSLGGSARVVFAATFACFMSAASLSAQGSTNVFDDAVFWFRGGKDLNGDGYMKQGEFFDDLHADDDSDNNHKMELSPYDDYVKENPKYPQAANYKANAGFRSEQVVFPALGTAEEMRVLHFVNGSIMIGNNRFYWPQYVVPHAVFSKYEIIKEYTIVGRMRLDDAGYNKEQCAFKIGYDANNQQGMYLGFSPLQSATGTKYITGRCTPNENGSDASFAFSDLQIPTNTWFDIAVTVGDGKLRVGVAAPATSSRHGDNHTIAFAETPMWTDHCALLSATYYRLFCLTGQTAPKLTSEADQSCFLGSVQQLAIWGRALTDQEVMDAFGMPRPAIFRTGLDNGNSNEFGGTRTGSSQEIDGLGSWQNIANTMKAGDTWTVNFSALRDEAGLPQIFSIKSLRGSSAQIEPLLNGTSLGENRVGSDGRTFWPVPANLVTAGANTLVIRRNDGGARDFIMDAMELGGSLGVGTKTGSSTDDGRVDPQLISTGVPSAADPNTQHWPTKLDTSTSIKDLHFRVWVDPDVVDSASFYLKTACKCDTTSDDKFTVYVNRNSKGDVKANTAWSKEQNLQLDSKLLHAGWNDIDFYSTATSPCWEFAYYRFETVLPSAFGYPSQSGLSVFIR